MAELTPARSRPRRLLSSLLALALVAVALVPLPAAASLDDPEGCFVDLINAEREAAGVAPLVPVPQLSEVLRRHSSAMAASGGLFHSTREQNAAILPPGWTGWGENVGLAGAGSGVEATCQILHGAFVNSPGHYANLMNPAYRFIAVGTVFQGGIMWTTHLFFAAPGFQPTPGFVGTFADDDGSPFAADIERIAAAGITAGCGPRSFCPDAPVTRAQAAAFIARALDLPAGSSRFADVTGSAFEDAVSRVAAAGITVGCAEDRFCPDRAMTRAEMAVFLTRALQLPPAPAAGFADVTGAWYQDAVQRVAAAGITVGCAEDRFCPHRIVTRGEMAAFLSRALFR